MSIEAPGLAYHWLDRCRHSGLEWQLAITADVLLAGPLSSGAAAELTESLAAFGVTPVIREVPRRRSFGDLGWLALIAVPLQPFYEELLKSFASDAHEHLKSLITNVIGRAEKTERAAQVLVLQDSSTGVQVVLEPDLPEDAFKQLLTFDLATIRRGPLHYDRHSRRWRSELDEA